MSASPPPRSDSPTTQPGSPAEVTLVWLTPPFGSFENAAIAVLMQRLCNPVEGSLNRRLDAAGWSRPRPQRQAWRNCGLLTLRVHRQRMVTIVPAGAVPVSVADVVDEELRNAAADVVDPVQLNRARALASRDALDSRAGFVHRARLLAEHEIIGGDVLLDAFDAARPAHVTAGDLAFAAKLLDATRRIVLEMPTPIGSAASAPNGSPASAPADSVPDERCLDVIAGDPALAAALTDWAEKSRQTRISVNANVAANARIECLVVPGSPLAWITIDRGPAAPRDSRLTLKLFSPVHQDYLTYHGLRLTIDPKDGTLAGSGPVDRIDSLLELAVRAIRESSPQAPAAEQWRIRCTGGLTIDDLQKAIQAAFE